jgi:hypothetical protein
MTQHILLMKSHNPGYVKKGGTCVAPFSAG